MDTTSIAVMIALAHVVQLSGSLCCEIGKTAVSMFHKLFTGSRRRALEQDPANILQGVGSEDLSIFSISRQRPDGFSLIELVIVLSILSFLCLFGISYIASLYRNNQLQKTADEIKQAIHFAKIEAHTIGHTVILKSLSENSDWSLGMRLFVDNKTHEYQSNSLLLAEWHWYNPRIQVSWEGFESTTYLRFSPSLVDRAVNGHFTVHSSAQHQIQLIVNRLARVVEKNSL